MSMGSLIASRLARSGHALANRAISQAPRAPLHTTSPLLSRLGSVARAFSSKPSAVDVIGIDLGTTNSCVSVMEGKIGWDSVMSLSTQEEELAGGDSASRLAIVNFH